MINTDQTEFEGKLGATVPMASGARLRDMGSSGIAPPAFPGLNNFAILVHKMAIDKGWYDTIRTFGDYIALFHSEISEAFEEYRTGVSETAIYYKDDDPTGKPEGVPIELADEIIRILDYCEMVGIDMENALVIKYRYNATRPYRHGGKTL